MALALAIAWLVEWVSWREAQAHTVAPRADHRVVVEEALPEPEPEPPSVIETDPPPAVEKVPDPDAVEADHEAIGPPPAALEAPEPVETAPETKPVESGEEPEPGEAPVPEALDAPSPRARRAWRGMNLRRVDPSEARTPVEPPTPAKSDPVEAAEPAPATASELEPPVEVESRPEPEPRPAYPPPRGVPQPDPVQPAPVVPPQTTANVVRMPRSSEQREWNVWELESLAREQARLEPERGEEWSYLFVHLRQFADAKGKLPSEFDGLVRESFGELLETLEPA
jgi:hypothetical protein